MKTKMCSLLILMVGIVSVILAIASLVNGLAETPGIRTPMAIAYIQTTKGLAPNDPPDYFPYVRYTRRDGATVRLNTPQPDPHGRYFNPVMLIYVPRLNGSAVESIYDSETNLVSTLAIPAQSMERYLRPLPPPTGGQGECLAFFHNHYKDLNCQESGSMLGYRVLKVHHTQPSGNPHVDDTQTDEYIAPALNWDSLKTVVAQKTTGIIYRTIEATSVTLGSPPERLFHVPRDAKMIPKSQLDIQINTIRSLPDCTKCSHPEADHAYNTVEPSF
jgi:hypothetical protein